MPPNPEMRPVSITVKYTGPLPPVMDQGSLKGIITAKFNEVSGILDRNHASVALDGISAKGCAPGTVPARYLQPLRDELKPHGFAVLNNEVPRKCCCGPGGCC